MTDHFDKEKSNRVGVIDVGSNSIRFVVFDNSMRTPNYFYNEKVMAGLGLDLAQTGKLHPKGKERALRALVRFGKIAKSMNLISLKAVATEAVRTASDGLIFCQTVLDKTGISLAPISGDEEAMLSAQGVLLGWPKASGLVCDIGGASMELAELNSGKIKRLCSSKLGPMTVLGKFSDPEKQWDYINSKFTHLINGFSEKTDALFLVGGAWRALAGLQMIRAGCPISVVHGYVVKPSDLFPTLHEVVKQTPEVLWENLNVSNSRIKLLPIAAKILLKILDSFEIEKIIFSSYGLREGLLYKSMPLSVRLNDPLIGAARIFEFDKARFPGFGDILYKWILPLFIDFDETSRRLIHAVCLIHDIHWRTHPDCRSEVCFESAIHINLGGLDHTGRVFLAWSLLHRYKAKPILKKHMKISKLLSTSQISLAETIGYLIRLGEVLSSSSSNHMGELLLTPNTLILKLDIKNKKIFGEGIAKHLQLVANSMDRSASLDYV